VRQEKRKRKKGSEMRRGCVKETRKRTEGGKKDAGEIWILFEQE
jgi:hypothetical protein